MGGSGGIAGVSGTGEGTFVGNAGDPGKGGTVSVSVGGPIAVSGASAHGVFAQSVSGKGQGDTSAAVTIDVDADVSATGSEVSFFGTTNPATVTIINQAMPFAWTIQCANAGFEPRGCNGGNIGPIAPRQPYTFKLP